MLVSRRASGADWGRLITVSLQAKSCNGVYSTSYHVTHMLKFSPVLSGGSETGHCG